MVKIKKLSGAMQDFDRAKLKRSLKKLEPRMNTPERLLKQLWAEFEKE